MPILDVKNEITLRFTYSCNWSCSYCAIRNCKEKDLIITHENILACINKIPNNSIVTISGGEPGLIEKQKIIQYLNLVKPKTKKLYLETNGLFIEKYPDLLNYFDEILYHCTSDLELPKIDLNSLDNTIYRFLLIIHDDNINFLETFLKNYSNIKFDIIEATYPYEITGPTLSKRNKNKLLTKYSKHITKDALTRLLTGKTFNLVTYLN